MVSVLEKAKRIIDLNQDLLVALEELDRTGRFRKTSHKKKVDFTIDEGVLGELRGRCAELNMPMSRFVENCIKEGLKE